MSKKNATATAKKITVRTRMELQHCASCSFEGETIAGEITCPKCDKNDLESGARPALSLVAGNAVQAKIERNAAKSKKKSAKKVAEPVVAVKPASKPTGKRSKLAESLAKKARGEEPTFEHDPRIPAVGTILVHKWRDGHEDRCLVLADGFEYKGEKYNSVTKIATLVCERPTSGFQFWGLLPSAKREQKREQVAANWATTAERYNAIADTIGVQHVPTSFDVVTSLTDGRTQLADELRHTASELSTLAKALLVAAKAIV